MSCVIEPTECSFEALTKGTFCTSRGKQCLHIKECPGKGGVFIFCPGFQDVYLWHISFHTKPGSLEESTWQHHPRYMCTTDPSQCSTETCHCEDPSHIRKALSCRCNLGKPVKSNKFFGYIIFNVCVISLHALRIPGFPSRRCRRLIDPLATCLGPTTAAHGL